MAVNQDEAVGDAVRDPARIAGIVHRNLAPADLYERALTRGEATLTSEGALLAVTAPYTGRSPGDKFVVDEPSSSAEIWWGPNQRMSEAHFQALYQHVLAHLAGKEVFLRECAVGADPAFRRPLRVFTEFSWHSLFAHNMFLREAAVPPAAEGFTVIDLPSCLANPTIHGTNSEAFVVLHLGRRLVLIGGTRYAGEIKKSVFSLMNYFLPRQDVLSMHCSANIGAEGKTALFFGLSGTGKTTLSADPARILIGDDEHGWSDHGIFNIEGGCYAKAIRLSPEAEAEIHAATGRFGTIVENIVIDPVTRIVDLDDESITENTRSSYPITFLENIEPSGVGGAPSDVVLLTADAFGVLPPISRLTPQQAMYHFLSGYTAKVAGTERGVVEPEATFSSCFAGPFMPLHPRVYATLLGRKIAEQHARVWLVNTGWSGGPYGVGKRMKIQHTRAMLHAALDGKLDDVPTRTEPFFGLAVPERCPDVPAEVLQPRSTWADPQAYDRTAKHLTELFRKNFAAFKGEVAPEVLAAGPQ